MNTTKSPLTPYQIIIDAIANDQLKNPEVSPLLRGKLLSNLNSRGSTLIHQIAKLDKLNEVDELLVRQNLTLTDSLGRTIFHTAAIHSAWRNFPIEFLTPEIALIKDALGKTGFEYDSKNHAIIQISPDSIPSLQKNSQVLSRLIKTLPAERLRLSEIALKQLEEDTDSPGTTILHLLAEKDLLDKLSFDLTKIPKSFFSLRNRLRQTPAHIAATKWDLHKIPKLFITKKLLSCVDRFGNSVLHAVCNNDKALGHFIESELRHLLTKSLLSHPNKKGETPLHIIAEKGLIHKIPSSLLTRETLFPKNSSLLDSPFIITLETGQTHFIEASFIIQTDLLEHISYYEKLAIALSERNANSALWIAALTLQKSIIFNTQQQHLLEEENLDFWTLLSRFEEHYLASPPPIEVLGWPSQSWISGRGFIHLVVGGGKLTDYECKKIPLDAFAIPDKHGNNAVHWAAACGTLATLPSAAISPKSLIAVNKCGATPLSFALRNPKSILFIKDFLWKLGIAYLNTSNKNLCENEALIKKELSELTSTNKNPKTT